MVLSSTGHTQVKNYLSMPLKDVKSFGFHVKLGINNYIQLLFEYLLWTQMLHEIQSHAFSLMVFPF